MSRNSTNAETLEALRMLRSAGDFWEKDIEFWWVAGYEPDEDSETWVPAFQAIFDTLEIADMFARRIVGFPYRRVGIGDARSEYRTIREYRCTIPTVKQLNLDEPTHFFDSPSATFSMPTRHGVLFRKECDTCDGIPF